MLFSPFGHEKMRRRFLLKLNDIVALRWVETKDEVWKTLGMDIMYVLDKEIVSDDDVELISNSYEATVNIIEEAIN